MRDIADESNSKSTPVSPKNVKENNDSFPKDRNIIPQTEMKNLEVTFAEESDV